MEKNTRREIIIAIVSSIIGGIILMGIQFFFGYFNINPVVKKTEKNVIEILKSVNEIKSNYIIKDGQGIEVNVGINRFLKGNNVSVFKDNINNLRFTEPLVLTNCLDTSFKPSVNLIITEEVERNDDKSNADLFISIEAAKRLGLGDKYKKGLYKLKLKTLELDENEKNSVGKNSKDEEDKNDKVKND
jgi:hypothetical protein